MSKVEARLKSQGLTLPEPPKPIANYVTAVITGDLVFLAGHGPNNWTDGTPCKGKLGRDLSVEKGYAAAMYHALPQVESAEQPRNHHLA